MSVLAAFCDTFVCVCVKGPEDKNNLEEIDEVGVHWVFTCMYISTSRCTCITSIRSLRRN